MRARGYRAHQLEDAFAEDQSLHFYVHFRVNQLFLRALALIKGAAEERCLREASHGLRVLWKLQTVNEIQHQVVDLLDSRILELVELHVLF